MHSEPPQRKVIRILFLLRVSFFSRSHFVLFVIPLVKLGTRGRLEIDPIPRSGLHLANESNLSHRWPTPTLNPSPKSHQQLPQQHFSLKKSSGFNKNISSQHSRSNQPMVFTNSLEATHPQAQPSTGIGASSHANHNVFLPPKGCQSCQRWMVTPFTEFSKVNERCLITTLTSKLIT